MRYRHSSLKYSGSALFRHFRRNHRMTQRQLALSLGVTVRHVKYIEAGTKFASPELIQRFKDLADCHEREPGKVTLGNWRADGLASPLRSSR